MGGLERYSKRLRSGSSCRGSAETNLTSIHKDAGLILASLSRLGIWMSCGAGRRRSSDLVLLCLWHRPAATAPIQPLAWKPPYAASMALKRHTQSPRSIIPDHLPYARHTVCLQQSTVGRACFNRKIQEI